MKLINLNTLGGKIGKPLLEFIKKYSTDTDIFCFQEVFPSSSSPKSILGAVRFNLFSDIKNILTEFNGYHAVAQENDVGGLAIFIKKSFVIKNIDHIIFCKELNRTTNEYDDDYFSMGRDLQRIEFINSGKTYTLLNFHGMWIAKGKQDTDKRIEQSKKLRTCFDKSLGFKILCTDLNVKPDTKSVAILEEGNINLIKEYKITSTRSLLKNRLEVVDYIITSPDVEVKYFKLLQEEVSDHLPMFLEFN